MKYTPGRRVRVADRRHDGHHRTPAYLKGCRGTVVRAHASFPNPETRAYGGDGEPPQPLYLVEFEQHDVWPRYAGPDRDRICVDVYEHWLEEIE